jgi:hypothetical protein
MRARLVEIMKFLCYLLFLAGLAPQARVAKKRFTLLLIAMKEGSKL